VTDNKRGWRRGKRVFVDYFDEWKLGFSIGRDPLIYIEGVILS
jgi:hypothetical protein